MPSNEALMEVCVTGAESMATACVSTARSKCAWRSPTPTSGEGGRNAYGQRGNRTSAALTCSDQHVGVGTLMGEGEKNASGLEGTAKQAPRCPTRCRPTWECGMGRSRRSAAAAMARAKEATITPQARPRRPVPPHQRGSNGAGDIYEWRRSQGMHEGMRDR